MLLQLVQTFTNMESRHDHKEVMNQEETDEYVADHQMSQEVDSNDELMHIEKERLVIFKHDRDGDAYI